MGLRAHSGWAVLVAVGDDDGDPVVLERRRIELVKGDGPRATQPYHAAAEMKLEDAEPFLRDCAERAAQMARESLRDAFAALEKRGYHAAQGAILLAAGRPLPGLASILASHPAIHTAEGEFFRNALRVAAESLGMAVTGIKERELLDRAAKTFGLTADKLQKRATELGKPVGRPWTQDEKLSCIAGWLVLHGA